MTLTEERDPEGSDFGDRILSYDPLGTFGVMSVTMTYTFSDGATKTVEINAPDDDEKYRITKKVKKAEVVVVGFDDPDGDGIGQLFTATADVSGNL